MKFNETDIIGSEYGATPAGYLIFDPAPWGALAKVVSEADLVRHNFFSLPEADVLHQEHATMMQTIARHGGQLIELADLLPDDPELIAEAQTNPNLFFTRDSSFAAPFLGKLVVKGSMGLPARKAEPDIIAKALASVGYDIHQLSLGQHDTLECGDVVPMTLDGIKTLFVGIGGRTTFGSAKAIASELPVDQVIAVWHPPTVLHLDTGFAPFPGAAIVADGMFQQSVKLIKGKAPEDIDALGLLKDHGYIPIPVSQQAAIDMEVCNVLALGNNIFVGFEEMGADLISKINVLSGATIHTTPGGELALTAGGVHCSTRPIYI